MAAGVTTGHLVWSSREDEGLAHEGLQQVLNGLSGGGYVDAQRA